MRPSMTHSHFSILRPICWFLRYLEYVCSCWPAPCRWCRADRWTPLHRILNSAAVCLKMKILIFLKNCFVVSRRKIWLAFNLTFHILNLNSRTIGSKSLKLTFLILDCIPSKWNSNHDHSPIWFSKFSLSLFLAGFSLLQFVSNTIRTVRSVHTSAFSTLRLFH